jgi:hypothetical protein
MDLAIDNRCINMELTSPVYFTKGTMNYIYFPQKVGSKNVMKANFITGIDRNTFGSALLYHLQRKEDTSISTQLLVIWGCKSDRIYFCTLLVEHESTLVWDRDKLKRLYDVYNSRCCTHFNKYEWLLNDEVIYELAQGSLKRSIIISKKILGSTSKTAVD